MKRIIFASVIAAIFLFSATNIQAQDKTPKAETSQPKLETGTQQVYQGPRFVDANKDGICDNWNNPNKERLYKNRDVNCDGNKFKKGTGRGNYRWNRQGFQGRVNR